MRKKKVKSLWQESGSVCKTLDIHKDAKSQENVNKGDVQSTKKSMLGTQAYPSERPTSQAQKGIASKVPYHKVVKHNECNMYEKKTTVEDEVKDISKKWGFFFFF